jgi:hypothetical protein
VAPPSQTNSDASNNHYIDTADWGSGELLLEIVSSDAGTQTVTVVANPDLNVDGLTISNRVLSIPAGATRLFNGFRPRTFRQTADANKLYLNPSVSTNLKFRAYKSTATT